MERPCQSTRAASYWPSRQAAGRGRSDADISAAMQGEHELGARSNPPRMIDDDAWQQRASSTQRSLGDLVRARALESTTGS